MHSGGSEPVKEAFRTSAKRFRTSQDVARRIIVLEAQLRDTEQQLTEARGLLCQVASGEIQLAKELLVTRAELKETKQALATAKRTAV